MAIEQDFEKAARAELPRADNAEAGKDDDDHFRQGEPAPVLLPQHRGEGASYAALCWLSGDVFLQRGGPRAFRCWYAEL